MRRQRDRFYRVLRNQHPGGAAARTAYLNYLQGLVAQGEVSTETRNRPPRVTLYLEPFSIPLAANRTAQASAGAPGWSQVGAVAPTPLHVTDELGSDVAVRIPGYVPPRISVKTLTGGSTVARSQFTNWSYKKPNGSSFSIPFGRNVAGDTVQGVFAALAAAYRVNNPNRRFTLIEGSE